MHAIRFGWTVQTNNTSIQYALDTYLKKSPDLPAGLGVSDGRDYYIQLRRDKAPSEALMEIRKNGRPAIPGMPSFGVTGGEQLHEFEPRFLALSTAQMAEKILAVLKADLQK